ncbi:hypothetical protein KPL78_11860 [Roseomonas sp. HJA6]|uniref:Uncharacterized protein n=1 Tax=Roseomonas alba TaxID=2846776 RepID=A0ABS7A8E2_9PROT|nr:hypothetical protein [Neoroseomonas alba]MBW6398549.1 hypothetical protein [Neoroseomonas alba]
MPTDLTVRSVSAAEPARTIERVVAAATAPLPEVTAPATPNPRLRLDSGLGMVVLEFRGTAGEVANTIPSSRAIEAYRAAALTDAPMPLGVPPRMAAPALPEAAPTLEPAPQSSPAPADA